MVEQYGIDDLKNVPWLGDARIEEFWASYRLIKSAVLDQLPKESAQIQMFYEKIQTYFEMGSYSKHYFVKPCCLLPELYTLT